MRILAPLRTLDRTQRSAFIASFLGWTLDAFDFFLMVFVIPAVAEEFHVGIKEVTLAVTATLVMRPVGAFLFGRLADRYGRRPVLMIDIVLFSVIELASAFAPSFEALLVLRALFGIAMGGEWGIGASLTMETVPAESRGLISGILQEGYAVGYLFAAIVYGALFDLVGWRGMFMVGVLPALLVVYIRLQVKESPAWQPGVRSRVPIGDVLRTRWPLLLYVVVLMTAFNFFSHGTQDLYPTFLKLQHGLSSREVGAIAAIYSVGAILGGIVFGSLSERIGRRRAIVLASLLSLPILPLWAYSASVGMLVLGAFLMQFMVQGAWGVIPAHLNELSPASMRGTFPGFAYQLGNLFASMNLTLQASIAESTGGDYRFALAAVAGTVAVVIAIVAALGREAKGVALGAPEPTEGSLR